MTVEKPKPKQLLRPITTGADSAMNQSQFRAITCNSLKARGKSRLPNAIGFGFAYHWLKNWCDSFKPIIKRSNRNHVITFESHLKTALFLARDYNACFSQIFEEKTFAKLTPDEMNIFSSLRICETCQKFHFKSYSILHNTKKAEAVLVLLLVN